MAHWQSTTNWAPDLSRSAFNEADLVRAARYGDKVAFQRLISQYDQLVLTFALNVMQSEDDARDIYEEVFLQAFRALPAQSMETSLFVWIHRLAACCCERRLSRSIRSNTVVPFRTSAHSPSTSRHSVKDGSAAYADTLPLRFSQLSTRERVVFVMTQCSRLRASTIAEILQVPELSVKQALMRAVYKLSASGISETSAHPGNASC